MATDAEKRAQHRALESVVAEGIQKFVFYSRKLRDDEPRNCKFYGNLFVPFKQTDLGSYFPQGWNYFHRTLCSEQCAALRLRQGPIDRRRMAMKSDGTKVNRAEILQRDFYRCYLCDSQTERNYKGTDRRRMAQLDHVIPLSSGGLHHPDNMRCCCARCNGEKGSKTLEQSIRISSCGDIDFDDLALIETSADLDELVSAWRMWVIPALEDPTPFGIGYADHAREKRWTTIYRRRIAELEALAASEPSNRRRLEDLSLGYIGLSNFYKRYGRRHEAIECMRKRLALCERLLFTEPDPNTGISRLSVAGCLYELAEIDDVAADFARLESRCTSEQMRYIFGAMLHMVEVAKRRAAAKLASNQGT